MPVQRSGNVNAPSNEGSTSETQNEEKMNCTMSGDDEAISLIERLSRLCALSNLVDNEETYCQSKDHAPEYSENLQSRAACLLQAAEQSKKYVDPKIEAAREELPIFRRKAELMKALEKNQVLIVIGETGSGKTSQVPQYLLELGLGIKGRIGCTQLRRMAARAVARRVAKEQGCKVGEEVGYTVRFDDKTGPKTKVQYMTDGILLRDCTTDRTLTSYSAIILDESHERTVDTDILLGVLRWIISQRNDLKLIISSATLDAEKFSSYFFNAKMFHICGRMHPVEIIYQPSVLSCVDAATHLVKRINESGKPGDIIVFMSGQYDIEDMCDELIDYRNSRGPELLVLPCYSALSSEEQARIFDPTPKGKRKVVIATNIAETSLTIDGIEYVIDSGFVKQMVYDHKREQEVLKEIYVSQAQAIQRAGRAGRLSAGKCYRLYSEEAFQMFVSGPEPEIKRSNLTSAVLTLKKMGFKDLDFLHFIDEPSADAIKVAEEELQLYAAINASGEITEIGRKMASFPLDPNLAKMLVASEQFSCAEEMLTIVALLSTQSIYHRPKKWAEEADAAKARFFTNDGDLLTMLNVYNEWRMYDRDVQWCRDNFIQGLVLHEVENIREQLHDNMNIQNMTIKSAGCDNMRILKSICSGMIHNVAQKRIKKDWHFFDVYVTLPKNENVFISRGSSLLKAAPEWVVYHKVVKTEKPYMREVTPINPLWLAELTPAVRKNPSSIISNT